MKYWWVNQGQTYRDEIAGSFLWSPKVDRNGAFNYSYETMTLLSPGDIIFSYSDSKIRAIGIVQHKARLSPKPEFGVVGEYWSSIGWQVDVEFKELINEIKPTLFYSEIKHLLPIKYSPLTKEGKGNQKVYLVDILPELASALISKSEFTLSEIVEELSPNLILNSVYEAELEFELQHVNGDVVKEQIILARRGQGVFRQRIKQIEKKCRVTNISDGKHLIASHIKPWALADSEEKLSQFNGLLLAPHIDHLFDSGWLTFRNSGSIIVSKSLDIQVRAAWGIPDRLETGSFALEQCAFLDFHRDVIFKTDPI